MLVKRGSTVYTYITSEPSARAHKTVKQHEPFGNKYLTFYRHLHTYIQHFTNVTGFTVN
jgi:hypothetical protein